MSDELKSIPGRARIVDGEGNPIDPDNPPWGTEPPPLVEPPPEAARFHGASQEPESESDDDDERAPKGGKHHARTVRGGRSRSS